MRYANVIIVLMIIVAPYIILLSSFQKVAFDQNVYKEQYTLLKVYDNPRFKDVDIDGETRSLITYLRKGDGLIASDFYDDSEKSHLLDVRELIRSALSLRRFLFFLTVVALVLLARYDPHRLLKNTSLYFIGAGVLTLVMMAIGYLVQPYFDGIFMGFHEAFFKPGTYLFDPATSNMINLFPGPFFQNLLMLIVKNSVFLASVYLLIGIVMLKVKKYEI